MRTLVCSFLLVMASCAGASAQTQSSDLQTERAPGTPELLPRVSVIPAAPAARHRVPNDDRVPYDDGGYLVQGDQCFTMRSYIVRRESTNSDVTTAAGYTECTPAARVKMKNAAPDEKEQK